MIDLDHQLANAQEQLRAAMSALDKPEGATFRVQEAIRVAREDIAAVRARFGLMGVVAVRDEHGLPAQFLAGRGPLGPYLRWLSQMVTGRWKTEVCMDWHDGTMRVLVYSQGHEEPALTIYLDDAGNPKEILDVDDKSLWRRPNE